MLKLSGLSSDNSLIAEALNSYFPETEENDDNARIYRNLATLKKLDWDSVASYVDNLFFAEIFCSDLISQYGVVGWHMIKQSLLPALLFKKYPPHAATLACSLATIPLVELKDELKNIQKEPEYVQTILLYALLYRTNFQDIAAVNFFLFNFCQYFATGRYNPTILEDFFERVTSENAPKIDWGFLFESKINEKMEFTQRIAPRIWALDWTFPNEVIKKLYQKKMISAEKAISKMKKNIRRDKEKYKETLAFYNGLAAEEKREETRKDLESYLFQLKPPKNEAQWKDYFEKIAACEEEEKLPFFIPSQADFDSFPPQQRKVLSALCCELLPNAKTVLVRKLFFEFLRGEEDAFFYAENLYGASLKERRAASRGGLLLMALFLTTNQEMKELYWQRFLIWLSTADIDAIYYSEIMTLLQEFPPVTKAILVDWAKTKFGLKEVSFGLLLALSIVLEDTSLLNLNFYQKRTADFESIGYLGMCLVLHAVQQSSLKYQQNFYDFYSYCFQQESLYGQVAELNKELFTFNNQSLMRIINQKLISFDPQTETFDLSNGDLGRILLKFGDKNTLHELRRIQKEAKELSLETERNLIKVLEIIYLSLKTPSFRVATAVESSIHFS